MKIPFVEVVEDARVKGTAIPVTGKRPVIEMTPDRRNVRIYCVSCHHPGAFVSAEMLDSVIYLCDLFSQCGCNCAATKGELTLPRLAL